MRRTCDYCDRPALSVVTTRVGHLSGDAAMCRDCRENTRPEVIEAETEIVPDWRTCGRGALRSVIGCLRAMLDASTSPGRSSGLADAIEVTENTLHLMRCACATCEAEDAADARCDEANAFTWHGD